MNSIRLAQFLLISAILISGWLTYESITASIGCGAGGDCSAVITSQWATLLGIPVALLGLFTYGGVLTLTVCRPFENRVTALLISITCLLIIGSALWFTALQVFIIKSFCPYCCAIHGLASLSSLILLTQTFKKYEGETPLPVFLPLMLSFSVIAGMVVLQFVSPATTKSSVTSTENHKHGAESTPTLFTLDPNNNPIFQGSLSNALLDRIEIGPESKSMVTLGYLYDWTCEYCVALHQMLVELANTPDQLHYRYQIHLLPYSHTDEGRQIHLQLASTKQIDLESYEIIELELHNKILETNAQSIQNRCNELIQLKYPTSPPKVPPVNKSGFKIAQQQLIHNQNSIHLSTVPQLFGVYSALTGSPTEEDLLAFLEKAAEEQKSHLNKK